MALFFVCFLWADFTRPESAFEFPISAISETSPMSASFLNHPITEADRITVSKDGHLQANGKRIKIYGTNLSDFPGKKDAAFTAKVLASQGYNCIRFHHIDSDWAGCLIKRTESGKRVFDEAGFDRFDYFFAELKKAGIYSNINFLTGRSMSPANGYRDEVQFYTESKTGHSLGFWDSQALEDQKRYAETILNHVNPYTGLAYKDDPAVALVEINNENGLMMAYLTGWLEDIQGYYWNELEDKWNIWLEKNGYDYEKLSTRFNRVQEDGEVLCDKTDSLRLEVHSPAKAKKTVKGDEVKIQILENGSENWHVQYNISNLDIKHSDLLTLKFSIKSDSPCHISVSFGQGHDPWGQAGFIEGLDLTKKYTDYEITIADLLEDSNLRLNFSEMGFLKGNSIYIKNCRLYKGGELKKIEEGYKSDSSKKTVKLAHFEQYKFFPDELKNIYMNFLYDTEEAYWKNMLDFVRKEQKAKCLVMGTVVSCSSPYIQSMFDIVDTHAYWQHPVFPNKGWDNSDYYVASKTMTRAFDDNRLLELASQRVFGKPFSVTEYDHPYPSQFSAEGPLMLASFASYQDWDCIFSFHSTTYKKNNKSLKITGFFDQSNNPAKSAPTPLAARIFRQSLVNPASSKVCKKLSLSEVKNLLYESKGWSVYNPSLFGLSPYFSLYGQLGVSLGSTTVENALMVEDTKNLQKQILSQYKNGGFLSPSKELFWDAGNGVYIISNDKVTISVCAPDASLPAFLDEWKGGGRLQPFVPQKDFIACVAVKENSTYLISSCSWSGNKNDQLRIYGSKKSDFANSLTRDDVKLCTDGLFGKGPALALSSDAVFSIKDDNYRLYKLAANGFVKEEVSKENGDFVLHKNDGTLWYLLKVE